MNIIRFFKEMFSKSVKTERPAKKAIKGKSNDDSCLSTRKSSTILLVCDDKGKRIFNKKNNTIINIAKLINKKTDEANDESIVLEKQLTKTIKNKTKTQITFDIPEDEPGQKAEDKDEELIIPKIQPRRSTRNKTKPIIVYDVSDDENDVDLDSIPLKELVKTPSTLKRTESKVDAPKIKKTVNKVINESETIKSTVKKLFDNNEIVSNEDSLSDKIDKIHEYLNNSKIKTIELLKDKEVLKWLFNDKAFVKTLKKTDSEDKEKNWGNAKMKSKDNKQWTTLFGQSLVKELYSIKGINLVQPVIKDNMKPDWICDEEIIEVKTRTYHTSGTAGEKILGTPIKYAQLLDTYDRDVLNIICVGYQEEEAINKFKLFENKENISARKARILNCINNEGIHYKKFTELLIDFVNQHNLTK